MENAEDDDEAEQIVPNNVDKGGDAWDLIAGTGYSNGQGGGVVVESVDQLDGFSALDEWDISQNSAKKLQMINILLFRNEVEASIASISPVRTCAEVNVARRVFVKNAMPRFSVHWNE